MANKVNLHIQSGDQQVAATLVICGFLYVDLICKGFDKVPLSVTILI